MTNLELSNTLAHDASKTMISNTPEKKMIRKICFFIIFECGSDHGDEHYLSSSEFFSGLTFTTA